MDIYIFFCSWKEVIRLFCRRLLQVRQNAAYEMKKILILFLLCTPALSLIQLFQHFSKLYIITSGATNLYFSTHLITSIYWECNQNPLVMRQEQMQDPCRAMTQALTQIQRLCNSHKYMYWDVSGKETQINIMRA